nr:MAG TPA: hypothetical protein [Inoviridae sp.]
MHIKIHNILYKLYIEILYKICIIIDSTKHICFARRGSHFPRWAVSSIHITKI